MIRLLRANATFRRLFLAHATSRAGDAFNAVALVVLVFRLTGSGRGVATTVAFEVVPVLLLGPFAGLVVDRYPRARVMVAADLARAVLAAIIAVSHDSTPLAYAVAFGLSAGALFFNPAAASLVPDVLDSPAEVVDANSALWTVAVAVQIVLAPLAGALIATLGIGWAFGANAVSYLVSAALLVGLRPRQAPAVLELGGRRRLAGGLRAVRQHPLLARLAVVQAIAALSAGATSGLLVVLAADRFGLGPSGFGMLLAAIAIGAVAGPMVFGGSIRPGRRAWLYGPFAVRGAVDLTLAVTTSPVLGAVALTVYGTSTSTGMVAYQSTLQTAVAPDVRGRVFAVFDVIWNLARLMSLGLGGFLADSLGIRAVYLCGGVLLLTAGAVGFAPSRRREQ